MSLTWIDIMALTQYENKWYLQAYIFMGHFTGCKTDGHHESRFVLMKHPAESELFNYEGTIMSPVNPLVHEDGAATIKMASS